MDPLRLFRVAFDNAVTVASTALLKISGLFVLSITRTGMGIAETKFLGISKSPHTAASYGREFAFAFIFDQFGVNCNTKGSNAGTLITFLK